MAWDWVRLNWEYLVSRYVNRLSAWFTFLAKPLDVFNFSAKHLGLRWTFSNILEVELFHFLFLKISKP